MRSIEYSSFLFTMEAPRFQMNIKNSELFEPKHQQQELVSQKDEKSQETLKRILTFSEVDSLIELSSERKKEIEKLLMDLIIPRESILYRLIWERAIAFSSSIVEMETENEDSEIDEEAKTEMMQKLTEKTVDTLLKQIATPILKFLLTERYRKEISGIRGSEADIDSGVLEEIEDRDYLE